MTTIERRPNVVATSSTSSRVAPLVSLPTTSIARTAALDMGLPSDSDVVYRTGTATLMTGDGPPTVVTSNTVVAAGPRTFLVHDCGNAALCALTVIDRPTRERHSLTLDFDSTTPRSLPIQPEGRIGSISPDGHTAVLFRAAREAFFVDLATGIGQGVSAIGGEF